MYFRFGASSYVYWNLALEGESESTWGWAQNSLIHVKDGKGALTPEFYLMKHFSHFVKRGAVMLETKGHFNTNTAVFKNPDGERVAVIMNPFSHNQTVTVEEKNYVLKPRSFNSIIL